MTTHRNQDQASPRFARGLALLALPGVVTLLVYSSLPKHTESGAPATAVELTTFKTRPLEALRGHSVPRVFHVSNSRADRWANALAAIDADTDLSAREEQRASLMAGVSLADISAVLDELQNAGLGAHEFTQRLLRRWAEADGRAAAVWADQLPAGAARDGALTGVAIEWANTNLESAVAWAKQLPDQSERQTALLAIANEAVRTEPMKALRLAVELPAVPTRDEAILRAASEWALEDGRSAVEWAKGIPDPSLRNATLAAEVISWSETSPETAATVAVESLPPGRLLEDTVVSIVQRWAQQQPEKAADWVAQFPPGELKVTAVENMASLLALQDRQTAEPDKAP